MIKAFTLLSIRVFVGVGLGALEWLHGSPTVAGKDKQRMWVKESGGDLADVPYPSGEKVIKVARMVSSGRLGWCTSAAGFYTVSYRGAFTIDLHTDTMKC